MISLQHVIGRLLEKRSRYPSWVNRVIDHAVDHPPNFLWRRLSPLARPADPAEIPVAPVPPLDHSERIMIGPVNYSGQGAAWARALEAARPGTWVHAFALEVPGGFAFPTDTEVPMHVYSSSQEWQDAQLAALARCTHAMIEAERPLLGRRFESFEEEARFLRNLGVRTAFMAHGTDVRVPSMHIETTPWSHFGDTDFYSGREEALAKRNIESLRRLGGPCFVSTPDLLHFIPEANWCPVVVDPERWRAEPPAQADVPVVVFAPSNPKVKGSDLVEPVLHKLHDEGVIVYRPIRGVPSEQMPGVYAEAEIVLDQFRLGSYGVAACEAMAAGRLVIGHVSDEVRAAVRRETGLECPIVEATPDTLERVLREFSGNPERRLRLSERGEEFVGEVHDGRLSARVLSEHWLDRDPPPENSGANDPLVDVIIATHTPERPVRRAVSSVLDHTIAPVRVTVVVHNTDPEPIRESLADFSSDPRLRIEVFSDGVASPAGPMNRGLELASAPYTSLLGSDDEISPGAIDRWLELARKHAAAAVIARLDFTDGSISPQPPVRPRYRDVRDPVKDRLSYRSAPLGLVSNRAFGSLRLAGSLATGEDIAYSLQLWFSGRPVVFAERERGYVVHTDGEDRVTVTPRPAADECTVLLETMASPWFRRLSVREREAIVVKFLRIQLLSAAAVRVEAGVLTEPDRVALRDARNALAVAAPRAERRLSRAEHALLSAVTELGSPLSGLPRFVAAWRRRFTIAGVLPRNPLDALHRQAPLRYGIASMLLSRRIG